MTEILILDFNRPEELFYLLDSLKKNANFDKKIVVLNNGGERYADQYKERGLCDKVIHNNVNVGCGLGTIQLFTQCETEYAFYVQVDHMLQYPLSENNIDFFKKVIKEGQFYVDVAGNQGQGRYSERAQFIRKKDYFKASLSGGGPGPLEDLLWTEESMQNYMEKEGLSFFSYYQPHLGQYPPFKDCGWSSVRENPDGSLWHHCPDTKVLKCLKTPNKEFTFPPLSKEEWEEALKGEWPKEGKIPEKWKGHSFEVWNKKPE